MCCGSSTLLFAVTSDVEVWKAALEDRNLGLSDQWLKHVRDVRDKHQEQLVRSKKSSAQSPVRVKRHRTGTQRRSHQHHAGCLVTTAESHIHGWIYAIENGLLRDLGVSISRPERLQSNTPRPLPTSPPSPPTANDVIPSARVARKCGEQERDLKFIVVPP